MGINSIKGSLKLCYGFSKFEKMKKLILPLIGLLFFACTAEEEIDPIVGTWRATVYQGYNVEKDLTFIFYSKGTLEIIEEPEGYPDCVLGCGGSWTNVTPTIDFNSIAQEYRIDMFASICNPNNKCVGNNILDPLQTGLSSNYVEEPFDVNVVFSNNFGSNNLSSIFLGDPNVPNLTKD